MLELKCVYMRPTPTHLTMLLPPYTTHTHTHIPTDKLRRRWLRCRRRFRRLAMTRGGQSRQWRQFHAKRTLINLLHTRVAPPSPVPDTCCAPVCFYVRVCVSVRMWMWVRGCHNHLRIAGATNSPYSLLLLLDFSAPGQTAKHSQKNAAQFQGKLH